MIRTKCEECGGSVVVRAIEYSYLGEAVGKFPAEVCTKCGETVFDEQASEQIERRVKQKGLYGLGTTTTVGVAGSSLVIRVSKKLAGFLQLRRGELVHIHPESRRRIVVEVTK